MTEQEAKAEALKRWPYDTKEASYSRGVFEAGAEWQSTRKPVAAPSDTEHTTPCPICRSVPHKLTCPNGEGVIKIPVTVGPEICRE